MTPNLVSVIINARRKAKEDDAQPMCSQNYNFLVDPMNLDRDPQLEPLRRNADGRPLIGQYALVSRMRSGAMGAVYYGVHQRLEHHVAVKVLPASLAANNELAQRFDREARLAARAQSPHLVSVIDINEESGVHYLVMEYVDGMSAGMLLRRCLQNRPVPPVEFDPQQPPAPDGEGGRALPERVALDIVRCAAKGLSVAHDMGIVHRDIKPDNILIPRNPTASVDMVLNTAGSKIADLGLARGDDDGLSSRLTIDNTTMGTIGYVSPEQIADAHRADKRSDAYSLGATLYALLAGRPPFQGRHLIQLIQQTTNDPPPPIKRFRPDLHSRTIKIIERSLLKNPDDRYQDAGAVVKALTAAIDSIDNPSDEPVEDIAQTERRESNKRVHTAAQSVLEEVDDDEVPLDNNSSDDDDEQDDSVSDDSDDNGDDDGENDVEETATHPKKKNKKKKEEKKEKEKTHGRSVRRTAVRCA
ncbi:MAG: serine/threonine-protein kinase [Planctomycetota bacterium]